MLFSVPDASLHIDMPYTPCHPACCRYKRERQGLEKKLIGLQSSQGRVAEALAALGARLQRSDAQGGRLSAAEAADIDAMLSKLQVRFFLLQLGCFVVAVYTVSIGCARELPRVK